MVKFKNLSRSIEFKNKFSLKGYRSKNLGDDSDVNRLKNPLPLAYVIISSLHEAQRNLYEASN